MAASYTFEDLSGTAASQSGNPYDGLIETCHNNPTEIQARYATHREARGTQQKEKLLSPSFNAVTIDQTLHQLETQPSFRDSRNCLVFWARPTEPVRDLIATIQQRLRKIVPNLWLMPPSNLHMTALEVTHSLTAPEIDDFVQQLSPVAQEMVDYTHSHRARLVKPKVTYDAQAMALSFLPADGEGDGYGYHHLRRDLYSISTKAGVKIASRYVVPSAHLTVGRFVFAEDFEMEGGGFDAGRMKRLVEEIEGINAWLETEYWPKEDGVIKAGGEWVVGQGKGLDHRKGTLWYGGGETIVLGKGF
ncbi:hypothetical protein K461DRAFT_250769 [Myriangium duriaei CBS 260.36]|uniref:RNA ligase/cyclic nucleotide phosphodiesterase n=1 Tax=Myriangium duriaei CBS 260.36 TaxID=1168546 RepID=A0A9P4J9P4_9PEZI|nr:hypothetical protein K461DRAFT_250769 [Myriangium duriaei CBS 260.36]